MLRQHYRTRASSRLRGSAASAWRVRGTSPAFPAASSTPATWPSAARSGRRASECDRHDARAADASSRRSTSPASARSSHASRPVAWSWARSSRRSAPASRCSSRTGTRALPRARAPQLLWGRRVESLRADGEGFRLYLGTGERLRPGGLRCAREVLRTASSATSAVRCRSRSARAGGALVPAASLRRTGADRLAPQRGRVVPPGRRRRALPRRRAW